MHDAVASDLLKLQVLTRQQLIQLIEEPSGMAQEHQRAQWQVLA
jgi:hypothetical protein